MKKQTISKQELVKKALIEKLGGEISNSDLLKKYSDTFRDVADMYSQMRSFLFAVAKTHPEETLKLLRSDKEIVMKSVTRSVKYDSEKRLAVTKSVLEGDRYESVAQKHNLSVARARGIFMEVVGELSKKYSLGIPQSYGKKQIIAEHKDKLIVVIVKIINKAKGNPKKSKLKKSSPKKR